MRRARGFTLLELMIALAIVLLLATLAAGNMAQLMADGRVNQATQLVGQSLRAARVRAMELSSDVTVTVSNTSVTSQVQNGVSGAVSAALPADIAVSGTVRFVFNPYGIASTSGEVKIASVASKKVAARAVTVSPLGQVIQ